jgi:hypothetical protein
MFAHGLRLALVRPGALLDLPQGRVPGAKAVGPAVPEDHHFTQSFRMFTEEQVADMLQVALSQPPQTGA